MTKLTANNPYVIQLFNTYHERIKTRPHLFNNGNMITVGLPAELLDYANAAAGHSGFGSGARPVGIRVTVDDSTKALKDIFSSCDSLVKFINASECNAAEYIQRVRERYSSKPSANAITIDTRMVKDVFYEVGYDFATIQKLREVFGADTVKRDWDNLQVTEFQLRYAI